LRDPLKSNIADIESFLRDCHQDMTQLKENLIKAQGHMKKFADLNRTERSFDINDWAYLKLQPYRQISF
jgi:hypothetical protein